MNTHKPSINQFIFLAAPILGHYTGPHTKLPPQMRASIPSKLWTPRLQVDLQSFQGENNLYKAEKICFSYTLPSFPKASGAQWGECMKGWGKGQEIIIFSSSISAVTPLNRDDLGL